MSFFTELKRRNVYKVAVTYAVVGWLVVQIATQVFPFLEISNGIVRWVIFAVAIGFPIALVIAWAFELTPEGIKRTEDVDPAGLGATTMEACLGFCRDRRSDALGRFVLCRTLHGSKHFGASPARAGRKLDRGVTV